MKNDERSGVGGVAQLNAFVPGRVTEIESSGDDGGLSMARYS